MRLCEIRIYLQLYLKNKTWVRFISNKNVLSNPLSAQAHICFLVSSKVAGNCDDDSDCPTNECCLSSVVGLLHTCSKYSEVGERCGAAILSGTCPCISGLTCVHNTGFLSALFQPLTGEGTCHEPPVDGATTAKPSGGIFSLFG